MLSQAWRTCAATASRPPGSPRNAGAKSITGIVRVTSATSFTAIALKMFMGPPADRTIPLITRLGRRGPSPATSYGSHGYSARRRARVQDVAYGVADEVERQHDHEDGQARQQPDLRAQDQEP